MQLERLLQSLDPVPNPTAREEQYTTPAGIAAEVLYIARAKGDIADRSVADLGCGNGVLAIGAKLLGARRVLGLDSESTSIEAARGNALRLRVEVEWRLADVRETVGTFETVVMNPPFGSQTRHADRAFLETAVQVGGVVYTFVNAKAEDFVRRTLESAGRTITDRLEYRFPIPHMFEFHREPIHDVNVLLFRAAVAKE